MAEQVDIKKIVQDYIHKVKGNRDITITHGDLRDVKLIVLNESSSVWSDEKPEEGPAQPIRCGAINFVNNAPGAQPTAQMTSSHGMTTKKKVVITEGQCTDFDKTLSLRLPESASEFCTALEINPGRKESDEGLPASIAVDNTKPAVRFHETTTAELTMKNKQWEGKFSILVAPIGRAVIDMEDSKMGTTFKEHYIQNCIRELQVAKKDCVKMFRRANHGQEEMYCWRIKGYVRLQKYEHNVEWK